MNEEKIRHLLLRENNEEKPKKIQEIARRLVKMESNKVQKKPKKFPNVHIPTNWIEDYQLYNGKVRAKMIGIFTFGEGAITEPHVEEYTSATYGALVVGTKNWSIWKPTQDPTEEEPKMKLQQAQGSTLYLPPGWFHRVETTSEWSFLLGESATTRASLQAAAQIQRIMPKYLRKNEIHAIDTILNINLSKSNRDAAKEARKIPQESSTRRDRAGKLRRRKAYSVRRRRNNE